MRIWLRDLNVEAEFTWGLGDSYGRYAPKGYLVGVVDMMYDGLTEWYDNYRPALGRVNPMGTP